MSQRFVGVHPALAAPYTGNHQTIGDAYKMVGALFAPPKRSGTPRKQFNKGSPHATLVCYTTSIGGPAKSRWVFEVPWMHNVGKTLEGMSKSPLLKVQYIVRVYMKRK